RVCSRLRLEPRLLDPDRRLDRVLAGPVRGAHEGRVLAVEADRHAHIALVGADAVGRVESDPAEFWRKSLGPGMRAGLAAVLVGCPVAGDETRRKVEKARAGDEDMGEVAW